MALSSRLIDQAAEQLLVARNCDVSAGVALERQYRGRAASALDRAAAVREQFVEVEIVQSAA